MLLTVTMNYQRFRGRSGRDRIDPRTARPSTAEENSLVTVDVVTGRNESGEGVYVQEPRVVHGPTATVRTTTWTAG